MSTLVSMEFPFEMRRALSPMQSVPYSRRRISAGSYFWSMTVPQMDRSPWPARKLNVFHWHLTEDQGWRIEIKKYPKLTSVGAFRKDSMTAPRTKDPAARKFAGRPHGGFYTQDDVREVVRYAAERGITVVPEIEMPGHAMAAIAAYPELGNTGKQIEVHTYWGLTDHVLGVTDNVLRFYAYRPVPKELSAEEAKHVLGTQGQIWTEYMPDPERVEYMAWLRLIALAEVLWSPPETRNWADFQKRLPTHLERLAIIDVNYRGRFDPPD